MVIVVRDIEFNNGFIVALALFYGHKHQFTEASHSAGHDMRIYAATDHIFNIEIPQNLSAGLNREVKYFVHKALKARLADISEIEGEKLFDLCKSLLKRIDKEHFVRHRVVAHYA